MKIATFHVCRVDVKQLISELSGRNYWDACAVGVSTSHSLGLDVYASFPSAREEKYR